VVKGSLNVDSGGILLSRDRQIDKPKEENGEFIEPVVPSNLLYAIFW